MERLRGAVVYLVARVVAANVFIRLSYIHCLIIVSHVVYWLVKLHYSLALHV